MRTPLSSLKGSGDVLILLGMALCAMSPAFAWSAGRIQAPPGVPTLYANGAARSISGFALSVGWLRVGWAVVICAVACGALLLFTARESDRSLFLALHLTLAGVVLAMAILHAGPWPGVVLAVSGGLLLCTGGLLKYGRRS